MGNIEKSNKYIEMHEYIAGHDENVRQNKEHACM
jgi:SUMO ligase MMS21 Smc5/6 complex component